MDSDRMQKPWRALGATAGLLGASAALAAGAASAQTAPEPGDAGVPQLTQEPKQEDGAEAQPARPKTNASSARPSSAGTKRYRIRSGDNLWSMSRDRLGSGASDAAVQRYLVRTWNLNARRMRATDPNVIPAGVVVTLPAVPKRR